MSKQLIVPPSVAGYWLAEIRNDNYAEGQTTVIFLPGIGESGQRLPYIYTDQGSQEATSVVLNRIVTWAGTASLAAATDQYGFNLVTLSAKHEYENGEILVAIRYARENLKAGKVVILSNSLGGYGLFKETGKNAEIPKMVDGIVSLVSGPGVGANTAKNIAASGVPIWILTVENDTASGTNPTVSIKLHNDIIAAGGKSYLTVYATGNWSNSEAHNLYFRAIPAWFQTKPPGTLRLGGLNLLPKTTATPLGQTGIQNLVTDPAMSVFEFLLNPAMDPRRTVLEQTPVSAPEPPDPTPSPVSSIPATVSMEQAVESPAAPTPMQAPVLPGVKPAPIYPVSLYLINDRNISGKSYLDVAWDDKTTTRYTYNPEDKLKAAFFRMLNGRLAISIEFYNPALTPIFIDRKPV